MPYCKYCGIEILNGQKICVDCLNSRVSQNTELQHISPDSANSGVSGTQGSVPAKNHSGSGTMMGVLALLLALFGLLLGHRIFCFVCAIVGFFLGIAAAKRGSKGLGIISAILSGFVLVKAILLLMAVGAAFSVLGSLF